MKFVRTLNSTLRGYSDTSTTTIDSDYVYKNKEGCVDGELGIDIGCQECQTSCQSACKTSSTVANQRCEKDTDGV